MRLHIPSFLGIKRKEQHSENNGTDILFTKILQELKAANRRLDRLEARLSALEGGAAAPAPPKDGGPAVRELAALLARRGETPQSAAARAGMLPGNITSILEGRQKIGRKAAGKLSAAFGIDREFLLTGRGKPYPRKGHRDGDGKPGKNAGKPC